MPIGSIRVVMIGQDPYPNGQANGLGFSVNEDVEMTFSLRVIEKGIQKYLNNPAYQIDKTLSRWSSQGIFLLNAALTMRQEEKKSHMKLWQPFIIEIIRIIAAQCTAVSFVSMGNNARDIMTKAAKKYPQIKNASYYFHSVHPDAEAHKQYEFNESIFKNIDKVISYLNNNKIKW